MTARLFLDSPDAVETATSPPGDAVTKVLLVEAVLFGETGRRPTHPSIPGVSQDRPAVLLFGSMARSRGAETQHRELPPAPMG